MRDLGAAVFPKPSWSAAPRSLVSVLAFILFSHHAGHHGLNLNSSATHQRRRRGRRHGERHRRSLIVTGLGALFAIPVGG